MYTALPARDRTTPGRIATLLLTWHAMGQDQAHFATTQDDGDGDVWVLVSTTPGHNLDPSRFIYPDDLDPNIDPDVCNKTARLYAGLPVGGRTKVRLGVRAAISAPSAWDWAPDQSLSRAPAVA